MPAGLERGQFPPRGGNAAGPRLVGEGDHAVGIADIERVPQQRHSERLVQSRKKRLPGFRDAVAIGVAQQRDAIRADPGGGRALHRGDHGVVEEGAGRIGDGQQLGGENVAVGQHMDPTGVLQAGRECVDREARRRDRRLPGRPPSGRRHLERRQAALRLGGRYRRRRPHGLLARDASEPPPEYRRSADLGYDPCKNVGQGHSPCFARTLTLLAGKAKLTRV